MPPLPLPPPPIWCTHRAQMGCLRTTGSACCFCSDQRLIAPFFNPESATAQVSQEQPHALLAAYCNACQEYWRGLELEPSASAALHLTRSLFGSPARQTTRHTRSSSVRSLGANPSRIQRASQSHRNTLRRDHTQPTTNLRPLPPPPPPPLTPSSPLTQNPSNMPPGAYSRPDGLAGSFHHVYRHFSNVRRADQANTSNARSSTNLDQPSQRQTEESNPTNTSPQNGDRYGQASNEPVMNDVDNTGTSRFGFFPWGTQAQEGPETPTGTAFYNSFPQFPNAGNFHTAQAPHTTTDQVPQSQAPPLPYFQPNWDNFSRQEFHRALSAFNHAQDQFTGQPNAGTPSGHNTPTTSRTGDASYPPNPFTYYPRADGSPHQVTPQFPHGAPAPISWGQDGRLIMVRFDENGQPTPATPSHGIPSAAPAYAPDQTQRPIRDPRRHAYMPPRRPSTARATGTVNQYDEFYARHIEHAQMLMAEARRAAFEEEDISPKGLDDANDERPAAKETEELTVNMECKVCMTQLIDTVVLPCGHAALCRWCADQHMARNRSGRPRIGVPCPVCRKPIKQRARIYLS